MSDIINEYGIDTTDMSDEDVMELGAALLHSRNIPCVIWSFDDVAQILLERVDDGDLPEFKDGGLGDAAREIWTSGLRGLGEPTSDDWDVIRSAVDRHFKINGHQD